MTIEFWTNQPDLIEEMPLIPASRLAAMNMASVPSSTRLKTTIKNCPGILDFMTRGYVLRLHTDITVRRMDNSDGSQDFEFSADPSRDKDAIGRDELVSTFHEDDLDGHFHRDGFYAKSFKINMPWGMMLPEGYVAILLPIYYEPQSQIEAIPGILHTDYMEKLNVNFRLRPFDGDTFVLTKGTPLLRIIPFRDEQMGMSMRNATFDDINRYREFMHVRKLGCPYKVNYRRYDREIGRVPRTRRET